MELSIPFAQTSPKLIKWGFFCFKCTPDNIFNIQLVTLKDTAIFMEQGNSSNTCYFQFLNYHPFCTNFEVTLPTRLSFVHRGKISSYVFGLGGASCVWMKGLLFPVPVCIDSTFQKTADVANRTPQFHARQFNKPSLSLLLKRETKACDRSELL